MGGSYQTFGMTKAEHTTEWLAKSLEALLESRRSIWRPEASLVNFPSLSFVPPGNLQSVELTLVSEYLVVHLFQGSKSHSASLRNSLAQQPEGEG